MILIPIAFVLLILLNASLARKKGLNPLLWGFITLVGFFVSYLLLGSIYMPIVYKGAYTPEGVRTWANQSPLAVITMILLGFAGMLLIRFILERKKTP